MSLNEPLLGPGHGVDRMDHVGGDADHPGLFGNRPRDVVFDPPAGVGAEFVAESEIELLQGPQQSEIAFLNEVVERESTIAVLLGYADDQPQIGLNHFLPEFLKSLMDFEEFADFDDQLRITHEEPVFEEFASPFINFARIKPELLIEADSRLDQTGVIDDNEEKFVELIS